MLLSSSFFCLISREEKGTIGRTRAMTDVEGLEDQLHQDSILLVVELETSFIISRLDT